MYSIFQKVTFFFATPKSTYKNENFKNNSHYDELIYNQVKTVMCSNKFLLKGPLYISIMEL